MKVTTISNPVTGNKFSAILSLPVEKLAIQIQYDNHVLATTLVPALLSLGYEASDLRKEVLEDLRVSIQPQSNKDKLLDKFDSEVERFILGQVTEDELGNALTLFSVINVKPDCAPGSPIDYVPTPTKGFKHTPSAMSGKRALRMLSSSSYPEFIRTHLKTFL